MKWSAKHDTLFGREILSCELWKYRPGTRERGNYVDEICEILNNIKEPQFCVSQKSVRDHFQFTNWTHSSIVEPSAVIQYSSCLLYGVGILEKLVKGEQIVNVSCKQVVPPTVNHFHHVVCWKAQESALQNGKPNLHICRDMQVPKLPLNHCKLLSRQVAASAQQVHKCPPCKKETQPCIRGLFSRQNHDLS